jgi:hypothetical protein
MDSGTFSVRWKGVFPVFTLGLEWTESILGTYGQYLFSHYTAEGLSRVIRIGSNPFYQQQSDGVFIHYL